MILDLDEFLHVLRGETRLLAHLITKAGQLDYRPSPGQRSTLELLQYLAIMPPIHLRAILNDTFDMDAFVADWGREKPRGAALTAAQAAAEIAAHPDTFAAALASADLRRPLNMFGITASRGAMLVTLVLSHYSAYRMQLFLYAKASGHPELNTLNLWAGVDHWPAKP